MKARVVYDSLYGNTEEVARAIGDALGPEAEVVRVANVSLSELETIDLLVVGSPTHGGRPTEAIQKLLGELEEALPAGIKVAAFDTRLTTRLVRIFGYAAGRIADRLEKGGGTLASPPEGFVVSGREGPLREGELERAANWAKELVIGS